MNYRTNRRLTVRSVSEEIDLTGSEPSSDLVKRYNKYLQHVLSEFFHLFFINSPLVVVGCFLTPKYSIHFHTAIRSGPPAIIVSSHAIQDQQEESQPRSSTANNQLLLVSPASDRVFLAINQNYNFSSQIFTILGRTFRQVNSAVCLIEPNKIRLTSHHHH